MAASTLLRAVGWRNRNARACGNDRSELPDRIPCNGQRFCNQFCARWRTRDRARPFSSPSSKRPHKTNTFIHNRHSFQGIASSPRGGSVTYVSATNCHPCVGSLNSSHFPIIRFWVPNCLENLRRTRLSGCNSLCMIQPRYTHREVTMSRALREPISYLNLARSSSFAKPSVRPAIPNGCGGSSRERLACGSRVWGPCGPFES